MSVKADTQAVLERVFQSFEKNDIEYVIPRKYGELPTSIIGDDVDVYVAADDFETAITVCEQVGFEKSTSTPIKRIVSLLVRSAWSPKVAAQTLFTSPRTIYQLIRREQQPERRYAGHGPRPDTRKLFYDDIKLDLSNHVAYRSPIYGSEVCVDPIIERRLFERRRQYNGFYVPAPVDELAHIVPHCVLDYHGDFSEYYVERYDVLVEEVTATEKRAEEFERLLSILFGEASDLVYESVVAGEYSTIRPRLRAFDGY